MMKKILLFGLVMLLSVAAIGQNKRVKGNFVGSKYAGKSVFIDTLGYTVVDSSAADIIQIDSVFQGALLQYDTTNGWEAADRAAILGYKEYVALLTQTGTDAPVATVLYNDLGGTVVWTRTVTGVYSGTLVGAFTLNKTMLSSSEEQGEVLSYSLSNDSYITINRQSADVVFIQNRLISDDVYQDVVPSTIVRIRVYN